MFSHLPDVPDSALLSSTSAAAQRRRVVPDDEFKIISSLQFQLYRELHTAAADTVRPPVKAATRPLAVSRLTRALNRILEHREEAAVFRQVYAHLANAALEDERAANGLLVLSSGQRGAGASFLKRLLRFAAADTPVRTVQLLIAHFLTSEDQDTVRAALGQLAGLEWALDPDDVHQELILDSGDVRTKPPVTPDFVIDVAQSEVQRFRELLLPEAESATPFTNCLAEAASAAWAAPDWHRIRNWRRRYVAAHTRSLDWAVKKAEAYRECREPLAPYDHPGDLEEAVVTQLRQEAERAASARLWQLDGSVAEMTLRRVQRRCDRATTPFDPRHRPSPRGMLFLDVPFRLPTGRRIVGYVWGPWSPRPEDGWMHLGDDGGPRPLDLPQEDASWTWVTPLTCDESLLKLPFAPSGTLLLRPGDTVEAETRLRDPENPERYRDGVGPLGRSELLVRHVRSLWELLTQHERSSVRVLAEQVHEAKPREQRSDRRRGITDSGQVTNVWVDPDAGERYRAQRRGGSGSGHKLTVRYWRGEHERDQCPNSHEHAVREATVAGSCPHYEITIPEHVVGPAGAPWSDRMRRARSRGAAPSSRDESA
ncbi:hypothetical protein [Streptomyces griseoaurantiacus]|uniref:hypothetical protein n=1 Tax=Streptomyces griseoaurantiacus TaxID=68213 RepID=UPI003802868A